MAVHTLGSTTAPTWGYNQTAQYNEVGPNEQLTAPSGGMYVIYLFAHMGSTSGGAITVELVLFNGFYNVAARSGSFAINGEAWQAQTITPTYIGSGSTCGVGWFVAQGVSVQFHLNASGHWRGLDSATLSSIAGAGLPGSPYVQGGLGYYLEYLDPLTISSISPGVATVGQSVTLSGKGFTGGSITSVTFNGVAAASWSVVSDTTLTAVVPAGATTGSVVVASDHGNGLVNLTIATRRIWRAGGWHLATASYVRRGGVWEQETQATYRRGGVWKPGE